MKREGRAVVLLSGGMDSATTLAIALRKHRVIALHFNYHQRTQKKELWCFRKLCGYYKVRDKIVIDMDFLKRIGGSTLFSGSGNIPEPQFKKDRIPSTYVPFRNGIMLSVAAAAADRFGARYIYIGAVEEDSSGYPDCRSDFIDAFERAVNKGTRLSAIKIIAPLISMTKTEIVKTGIRLNVPYEYTWSCYRSDITPCMRCESCYLRARGFEGAGQKDPIITQLK
ncbi:MAG: 7-cyano-7-deazaguanine synthase QueC [Deltaproteobacteria bacterium]|nr:7-cyano-7-deazaguanine synthase QueC [Deltaproteobacteria bacterium]